MSPERSSYNAMVPDFSSSTLTSNSAPIQKCDAVSTGHDTKPSPRNKEPTCHCDINEK